MFFFTVEENARFVRAVGDRLHASGSCVLSLGLTVLISGRAVGVVRALCVGSRLSLSGVLFSRLDSGVFH